MKSKKLTDEKKSKWMKIVTNDFMSSEESDGENLTVHPLPWRSDYVNRMFERIDVYCKAHRSAQANRQSKNRVEGSCSKRSPPEGDYPEWSLNKTTA